jgi:hypothetical protein
VSIRSWWEGLRNALRASSLIGRAFGLRDRGRLEEALVVCREAIRLAGPVDADHTDPSSLSTIVIGAVTIDEIATRLGQPQLAREPLANALLFLQPFNRSHPTRKNVLLLQYEQRLRSRLEELRSAP